MDEARASEPQVTSEDRAGGGPAGNPTTRSVQAPEFEDAPRPSAGKGGARPSIDIVMDVPVTLSLEVGRATMSVGELLELGQGAVVELDRAVGEPLDVMVNGALVAKGEIVLVNDKFGIRLTSIIEPGCQTASD